MFGLKGVFDNEALIKGLVIQDNKESVDDKAIVECDGFIQYEAVLKKDFSCVLTSGEVDNIDYIPPTEMPICIAGEDDSEINYDDPDYPWTAPTPSVEITETSSDYITNSKLRWATGTISEIDQGVYKYINILGSYGTTLWNIDLNNFFGSITHNKISNSKIRIEADKNAGGSISLTVYDAFKSINKTITVPDMTWVTEPPDDIMSPGDTYWVCVKNSKPFAQGEVPEWYVNTEEFEKDQENPESHAVNGVYLTDISNKQFVDGYIVNFAKINTTEDASGSVTIKCKDDYVILEKEITIASTGQEVIFTQSEDGLSILKDGIIWKEGFLTTWGSGFELEDYDLKGYSGYTLSYGVCYNRRYSYINTEPPNVNSDLRGYYYYCDSLIWNTNNGEYISFSELYYSEGNIYGSITKWNGIEYKVYNVYNNTVVEA